MATQKSKCHSPLHIHSCCPESPMRSGLALLRNFPPGSAASSTSIFHGVLRAVACVGVTSPQVHEVKLSHIMGRYTASPMQLSTPNLHVRAFGFSWVYVHNATCMAIGFKQWPVCFFKRKLQSVSEGAHLSAAYIGWHTEMELRKLNIEPVLCDLRHKYTRRMQLSSHVSLLPPNPKPQTPNPKP